MMSSHHETSLFSVYVSVALDPFIVCRPIFVIYQTFVSFWLENILNIYVYFYFWFSLCVNYVYL